MKVTEPTSQYSKELLRVLWKSRGKLTREARRGLVQFAYQTMCAHLEEVLVQLIANRLKYIVFCCWDDRHPSFRSSINGKKREDRPGPVFDAIVRLAQDEVRRTASRTLNDLLEKFDILFPRKSSVVLGGLKGDLLALREMRNVLAHGRNVIVHFGKGVSSPERDSFESMAARLKAAKILKIGSVTGMTWIDLMDAIHSDAAVMYLYKAVLESEARLVAEVDFEPEKREFAVIRLPKLDGA